MKRLLQALVCLLVLGGAQAGSARASERWVSPVPGAIVVARGFDPPAQRWQPGHRGVDLVTTAGAEVRAAGTGTVTFAGVLAGRGVVTVTHGRLRTTYEPVRAAVRVGEHVTTGSVIGHLSPGHGHAGPGEAVLHWGLRQAEAYLDPMSLLRPGPPRLLPHWSERSTRQVANGTRPSSSALTRRTPPSAGLGPDTSSGRGRPLQGGGLVAAIAAATAVVAVRRRG